jgi:hypothetical protein
MVLYLANQYGFGLKLSISVELFSLLTDTLRKRRGSFLIPEIRQEKYQLNKKAGSGDVMQ